MRAREQKLFWKKISRGGGGGGDSGCLGPTSNLQPKSGITPWDMSILFIKKGHRAIEFKIIFIIFVRTHKLLISIELSWKLLSFTALLIFSHLQIHYCSFDNFFFIYFINDNIWLLSLAVLCFVFNFNSRKCKQTLIVVDL